MRSDPSPATESSLSTNDDLILWEIEEYAPNPRDNKGIVDCLVEGDEEEEEASMSGASSDFLEGVACPAIAGAT